jgi:hypothetical protein
MTATLVLSGTSSAGTPPIASKAPTWPLIQSASPHPPCNLAGRHPRRLRSDHIAHVAHRKPLRRHPGPLRKAERRDRIGARRGLVTPGDIIPEWWATPSGISTLYSATELAEIYSRLSGARRPLIDASGPEACSPNEESASDHCDRDVPDIALRYNRNALPVTSYGEVQVCRESGSIRGGADMAAIGTPLKGPTDSPARLAPGAREPRAIADDIAAQLKPVAVARASQ